MKNKQLKIGLLITAIALVVIVPMHMAHAWLTYNLTAEFFSWLGAWAINNFLLPIAGYFLYFCGALMNMAIDYTLRIKSFVDNTPGVYMVWQSIRDVSGMLIIFLLLYEAVKMILGFDEKFGSMIKNIIIGGILINFSFFLTGVLIDASNIVSLAIYKGITSQDTQSLDGGISGVLMQNLKVQSVFDADKIKPVPEDSSNAKFSQTVLVGIGGIMIMITTGLSFLAASLAFLARFIILVFLLAFSPIWFIGMIFPDMKQWTTKFWDQLKSQLIFMPIYLYLLYAAMAIITRSSLLGNVNGGNSGSAIANFVSLAVDHTFVIIMINLPLVAGLALAGMAKDFMNKIIDTKKFSAQAMWGGLGGWGARNTLGAAASGLQKSRVMGALAAGSPRLGVWANKGLKGVSSAGFGGKEGGYDAAVKQQKKDEEELYKQVGTVDRSKYKTEAEANAAEERAKARQAQYVKNLGGRSVFNLMMKDRASQQTAYKLDTEVNAKEYEKQYKELMETMTAYKEAMDPEVISNLKEEIINLKVKSVISNGSEQTRLNEQVAKLEQKQAQLTTISSKGIDTINKEKAEHDQQMVELKAKKDRIGKSKQDKTLKDMAKRLKDLEEKPEKDEKKDEEKTT